MKKFCIAVLTILLFVFTALATACGGGSPSSYVLTFYVEGNIWENRPVTQNQVVVLPAEPFKNEHVFDGWYFDEGVWLRPFNENSLVGMELNADVNVYAKFTEHHEHFWAVTPHFNGTHTKTCELNSDHTVTENCSGGTATCTQKAVCSTCHYEYGEALGHNYVNDTCDRCGKSIFSKGLEFILLNDAYEVALGTCEDMDVYVPPVHENLPVTRVADNGFYNCNRASITLPDSITAIGKNAFSYCYAAVIFGENTQMEEIGESAFACYGGKSLVLPDSVTSIGDFAFELSALETITLPSALTSIGESAFARCEYLTELRFPNTLTHIGHYAVNSCAATIVWGDNPQITELEEHSFSSYCGTSLTIPETVTKIGKSALSGLPYVESLTIPNAVTSIGLNAFSGCLTAPILWGDNPQITELGDQVFCDYYGESVTLPSTITKMDAPFYGCHAKTVTIPRSVTSIGSLAFNQCTSQIIWESNSQLKTIVQETFEGYEGTSLTIPNGVTTIGRYAFGNCPYLESATLPNSVTSIDGETFMDCTVLKNVTLSTNLQQLSFHMFARCYSLESITIPNSVTSLDTGVFSDCSKLKSISLPSVTDIGFWAFANCTSLTSISMPKAKTLGESAFKNCAALTSITLPNTVTELSYSLFMGCSSLKDISLSAITSIGSYAFDGCTSLTEIVIPQTVTLVGEYSFRGCSALTLYCEAKSEQQNYGGYTGWHGNCPIVWNCNENDVATDGCIYTIVDGVRYGISNETATVKVQASILQSADIPQSITYKETDYDVTQIDANAFYSCKNLTSIVLTSGIQSINSSAFGNVSTLQSVYYMGTESEWTELQANIGNLNDNLTGATVYYYSASAPALNGNGTAYVGNFWRYVNGVPTPWVYAND